MSCYLLSSVELEAEMAAETRLGSGERLLQQTVVSDLCWDSLAFRATSQYERVLLEEQAEDDEGERGASASVSESDGLALIRPQAVSRWATEDLSSGCRLLLSK